jgi:hypothetical protein
MSAAGTPASRNRFAIATAAGVLFPVVTLVLISMSSL